MQRFRAISRVNLFGIPVLGLSLLTLLLSFFDRPLFPLTTELRPIFLEEWWKTGQENFWSTLRPLPPPTEDSLALDRLISWRAHPSVLSTYEISDLSQFLLQAGQQYRISPVLVLSLIEVESSYRKSAVSSKGAMGMMQLMPGTAQQMAQISGVEWNGPSDLQDPKSNIEYGLRYINYLKQYFHGQEHVLTAYNIGPSALRRKLQSGEKLPSEYYDRVMGTFKAYQDKARANRAHPKLWKKTWL